MEGVGGKKLREDGIRGRGNERKEEGWPQRREGKRKTKEVGRREKRKEKGGRKRKKKERGKSR